MRKVKVNQVVAGWIEDSKKEAEKSFIKGGSLKKVTLETILKRTSNDVIVSCGMDIVTLAQAIQYGYEVPYEFKVGDIVYSEMDDEIHHVVSKKEWDTSNGTNKNSVDYVNKNKEIFKLICKVENREDRK